MTKAEVKIQLKTCESVKIGLEKMFDIVETIDPLFDSEDLMSELDKAWDKMKNNERKFKELLLKLEGKKP